MKYCLAALALLISLPAYAQAPERAGYRAYNEFGFANGGEFLTSQARKRINDELVREIASNPELSREGKELTTILLRQVGQVEVRAVPGEGAVIISPMAIYAPVRIRPAAERFFASLFSPQGLAPRINVLPLIEISVRPAPPRDYTIMINGERCPPTERSAYRVEPGPVTVKVERQGKPTCDWRGSLLAGEKHSMDCPL